MVGRPAKILLAYLREEAAGPGGARPPLRAVRATQSSPPRDGRPGGPGPGTAALGCACIVRPGEEPVMTGPDDGAAARGRLRAAHADREQVIEMLKAAFVQGRLDKGEFDTRVGQVFTSRTYAELADLTADLPARAAAARPPGPGRARAQQPVLRPSSVIMAASLLYAGLWVFLLYGPSGELGTVVAEALALLTAFCIVTVIGAGIAMVASRQQKRRGRQLPPRPAAGAGGQASQSSRPAGPAGQIPPIEGGRPHTAEAARRRRSPARPCPAL